LISTVAVLGMTGSGKSFFVQQATGCDTGVSSSLTSATTQVTVHRVTICDKVVDVFDTPGFDDTNISDEKILSLISERLVDEYRNGRKLTGIIFLVDVSTKRMTGTMVKFNRVFRALCGEAFFGNVVITTNRWDQVSEVDGTSRVDEMKENYYNMMIKRGTRLCKFDGTATSAEMIVSMLLESTPMAMQHQVDIVDNAMLLEDTAAVTEMASHDAKELQKQQSLELAMQKLELQTELEKKEDELEQRMKEQCERQQAELDSAQQRMKEAQDEANRNGGCVIL
jgi:GTPase Era involved in 16S rRNA processing